MSLPKKLEIEAITAKHQRQTSGMEQQTQQLSFDSMAACSV
jgi:hypothetical protein